MPPPEKLKCKLLMQDAETGGLTRVTVYALSIILRMAGHKSALSDVKSIENSDVQV